LPDARRGTARRTGRRAEGNKRAQVERVPLMREREPNIVNLLLLKRAAAKHVRFYMGKNRPSVHWGQEEKIREPSNVFFDTNEARMAR